MEKNSSSEQQVGGSSHSWWLDNHNRPQYQSLWLQSTLSEFGTKIKTMLTLIEDDGDTFAKRAEMFYQKRPQLIKLLEDLHRSFCALANKYDIQLKSSSDQSVIRACSSSSNSLMSDQLIRRFPTPRGNQEIMLLEAPEDHSHDVHDLIDSDDHEFDNTSNFNFQEDRLINGDIDHPRVKLENGNGHDQTTDDQGRGINGNYNEYYHDDLRAWSAGNSEIKARTCNEVASASKNMSKLFEDNFRRQAELVTKVDATVKELCAHIDKLANEKRALKIYCAQSKVEIKRSRSNISRLKESILKKLLR